MKKKKYICLLAMMAMLIGCTSGQTAENEVSAQPETAAATSDHEVDHTAFAKEYTNLTKDNVFYYGSQEDVLAMLEHGSGIVYFGFADCPWCQQYVVFLNEAAASADVEVMYYDIKEDREENTEFYQEVVEILKDELDYDSDGKPRIYVPDVSFVKEGEIFYHNNESSQENADEISPEDYWTEEKITALEDELTAAALEVKSARDSIDEKGCDDACSVERTGASS